MCIDVIALEIPEVKLIVVKRFVDSRGFVSETYNGRSLAMVGIDTQFVQDNHSLSVDKGTIRGMHFQTAPSAQDKLVRVTRGRILDVSVDVRGGSPTYGKHVAVELSSENWNQLLVPKGFAHGLCTLESYTEVLYKFSDYYDPKTDGGILWNDSTLEIEWPDFAGAQVSPKDAVLPLLADIPPPFTYEG